MSINFISLFTGCGGLDIGAFDCGFQNIISIDNNSDCLETLKINKKYHHKVILHSNINSINPTETLKNYKNTGPLIIIGGPPCQPFSKNKYWITNKKRQIEKDPKNGILGYLNFIQELKPDGFLFENVESILHPTNKHVVDNMLEVFDELGYNTKIFKLNSLNFGVPQKRKRIFITGIMGKFKNETFTIPDKEANNIIDFISEFDSDKYFENEELITGTYKEELINVPPGKNYISLTLDKNNPHPKFSKGSRFWNFLLKLHPNLASWTIPAQPGTWIGPFHWTNRRLRVPEISAIQGFPKNYKYYGSRRSIQMQIGNAVPPPMAKNILNFLGSNFE